MRQRDGVLFRNFSCLLLINLSFVSVKIFKVQFLSSAPETVLERPGQRPFRASYDSDLEVDSELPELTDFISKEDLRQMKDKERKRQQIINGEMPS